MFYFFSTLIQKVDVLVDISKNQSWTLFPPLQPWIFCHSPTPCIDYRIWSRKSLEFQMVFRKISRAPQSAWWCAYTHSVQTCHHDHASSKDLNNFVRTCENYAKKGGTETAAHTVWSHTGQVVLEPKAQVHMKCNCAMFAYVCYMLWIGFIFQHPSTAHSLWRCTDEGGI